MYKKILICGLPGAGKTTLARVLVPKLNAVHFNADEIRQNINKELGFSNEDRIEQARRMGWLCTQVVAAGHFAVSDFVCPTEETRNAFGPGFVIWINRINQSRFADTNRIFTPPLNHDIEIKAGLTPEQEVELVLSKLMKLHNL